MYDIVYIGKKDLQWQVLKKKFVTLKHAMTFREAQNKIFTNMFWTIWGDIVQVKDSFDFSFVPEEWDQNLIHVFKNLKIVSEVERTSEGTFQAPTTSYVSGVSLIPKNLEVSDREIEYKFFVNKKEIEIIASQDKQYDVVFISYNELNADENYFKLLEKVPYAQRINGVKGIHQAHIEAAKIVSTEMFYVVDADALIMDEFEFNHQLSRHEVDIVHVWRSQNPINSLVYGHGGVKLLPRKLTLDMDVTTTDMTTTISKKFKPIQEISNITAFNTDPFNTWKSAFRECVKLASKIIPGQKNDETNKRLEIWCTEFNQQEKYGEWAIKGAIAGRKYGLENADNIELLKKINDFDWLQEQFND